MKTKILTVATATVLALSVSGCATAFQSGSMDASHSAVKMYKTGVVVSAELAMLHDDAMMSTISGAGIGAGLGALFGSAKGEAGAGLGVGLAVGALLGYVDGIANADHKAWVTTIKNIDTGKSSTAYLKDHLNNGVLCQYLTDNNNTQVKDVLVPQQIINLEHISDQDDRRIIFVGKHGRIHDGLFFDGQSDHPYFHNRYNNHNYYYDDQQSLRYIPFSGR
jgi:outer membrane lipoprotein SlyB